ncbi:SDR family NAD(P)-dependent oxidoreductase [Actinomadura algeriensis]|uniref:NAD(P)-dependent dehydrogenase (Short-subunit alcohol dehydrogenase family) n=1 Tax=Actinomadura algeriensis TaxID=1679523 RepID=A0ABR9K2G0_9ACTN|nr:SDR family NAD(P)-dependent oxidoreductase [Actinomadura algeriensis]MBE1537008.1 NAD(P)-dependent dehydrogenase (short-subunit alcohol dehydrogenase family) [Actinomadura algeriensis]
MIAVDEVRDKAAVVTGGASGIGFAMARKFLSEGMSVAIGDIEADALDDAVRALRGAAGSARVIGLRADVTAFDDVARLCHEAERTFGGLDVVCANAGVETGGRFLDVAPEAWRWVMDVNYFGTLNTARAALPILERSDEGHLVITGSLAGFASGTPFMTPYCATKMAIHGLAESLEVELRASASSVSVHLLAPGPVQSRMIDAERNAPAGVPINEDPERRRAMEDFRARQSAEGLPAAQVADLVVEAIGERRFFVLPHRERAVAALRRRLEWVETGRTPESRVAGT